MRVFSLKSTLLLISCILVTLQTTFADALKFPGKGSRADFDKSSPFVSRGCNLARQGKYKEAIDQFTQANNIYPYSSGNFCNLGLAFSHNNEFDKSIEAYKKAIQLDQNCTDSYGNLADVYLKKKDFKAAEAVSKQELQLDPKDVCAQVNLAEAYLGQRKPGEALRCLQIANTLPGSDKYKSYIDKDLAKANSMLDSMRQAGE